MGHDLADLEGEADALYRAAGFDPDDQAPSVALVRRLMGENAIRAARGDLIAGNAALVRVGDEWRIYIRTSTALRLKRFALLHELAHWALGYEATESECDTLAAALLVPRRALLRDVGRVGEKLPRLASRFQASETCIALRVGETTDSPMALITPKSVRVRGAEWSWPLEPELRSWAKQEIPGLKKARLRDDPRRTVLKAIR